MLKPADLLYVQDPDAAAVPVHAHYQQAARHLVPLINQLANGDDLTLSQLADIGVNGWRLFDGLLNNPYEATEPINA